MKALFAVALLSLSFGVAQAETSATDATGFGAKDARGAYQEVRIQSLKIAPDYFTSWELQSLKSGAESQNKYDIWPDSDANMRSWGRNVELTFQDGELKTQNADSKNYKQLDKTKTFAVAYATVAFDNKKQAQTGVYSVDGVVTLVTGQFGYGPVTYGSGKPAANFQQSAVMGYIMSGAYYHDCNPNCVTGGQFNQFGNGKNDGGRIHSVGLISTDPSPLSVGQLKQALGALVQVVYP
jgi:hypothetical protein